MDIYEPAILANLSFICVMKKNYLLSRQFVEDYINMYGGSEVPIDQDEDLKIILA